MQAEREAMKTELKDMTAEERKAFKTEMHDKHAELQQWAADHGLSEETLRDLLMVRMVHHAPGAGEGGDVIRMRHF
jgi:hypothetical protein